MNLSAAAKSDSYSHYSAKGPDVPESDVADADSPPEPTPSSVVSRPDSVLAVSTSDSAPVIVTQGLAPTLVIVTHSSNPDPVSVSLLDISDDNDQGDVVCTQPQVSLM